MNKTQQFLPFKEIREGVLIMPDNTLRGIIYVSSINFDLKSDEEQKAIIYQFQSFLNSLDFSTQIIVNSRRLNITGYFDKLKELEKNQKNELLKIQTREYRKFIENLVGKGTIMKKNFFVVVPLYPGEVTGIKSVLKGDILSPENFKVCRDQLWQRMEFIAIGLRRCGLSAMPLSTPEIIELLWSWHHPAQSEIGYYPEILPELIK
jgi:type IV secretory pathway VirB4 component